jgi:hypothetical protein
VNLRCECERNGRIERTTTKREEAFDLVEPGGVGWREVNVPTRPAREPGLGYMWVAYAVRWSQHARCRAESPAVILIFNYASVGTYTSWTPVKGLTFLAELNYLMLDQKYASGSTVTLPLQSSIAKPGAAYELKNQNSLTMLLHAQRNW